MECTCLARGGVGGEWMRGLGLGFTDPVGRGECGTCVCVRVAAVWVLSVGSRCGFLPGCGGWSGIMDVRVERMD